MVDHTEFVRTHTELLAPPLVPELELHLATEVTPLWEATETTLSETGLPPPFWAFAWPGSQALARLVLDAPEHVRGRRVLDFACGCAVAGLAAARAGAAEVRAADLDAFALAAVRLNADHNALDVSTTAEDLVGSEVDCEVILAGDVCYEAPMSSRVAEWLFERARTGTVVLLADPGRAYVPQADLAEVARYLVPTTLELEDRTERETIVWRLTPTPATAR